MTSTLTTNLDAELKNYEDRRLKKIKKDEKYKNLQVATNLDAELHKYEDRGHFMDSKFPELIKAVTDIVKSAK